MNIGALVLSRVLQQQDLEAWSKLKIEYFSSELKGIYRAAAKFYNNKGNLPNLYELELVARNQVLISQIHLLSQVEVPEETDTDLIISALVDDYIQKISLDHIDRLLDDVTFLEAEEILDRLQDTILDLEERTHTTSGIVEIKDISIIEKDSELRLVPIGFSNKLDNEYMGAGLGELWLFGGYRGSGKSVLCSNIQVNEYLEGHVCPYFSIEMPPDQVFRRNFAIESGVDALRLRNKTFSEEDSIAIARTLCSKHIGGEKVFEEFLSHKDLYRVERERKQLPLTDITMPVIFDQEMTLTDIDLHLKKLKARYGDLLRTAVVDYINAINIKDIFDWKTQIYLAKALKKLALKYDVWLVSPFQVDASGGVRFSKGILDSADAAFNLEAHGSSTNQAMNDDSYIKFTPQKVRDLPPKEAFSRIDWKTLKIDPEEWEPEEKEEDLTGDEAEAPFDL